MLRSPRHRAGDGPASGARLLLSCVAAVSLLACVGLAHAAKVIVPDDFPTIQAAVARLESLYVSDTILVRAGNYPERPRLRLSRVVRAMASASGPEQAPVIDGVQVGSDNGEHFVLDGLRFSGQVAVGGANAPDRVEFRDCRFDAGAIPGSGHDYPDFAVCQMTHCTLYGTVWIRVEVLAVDSCDVHGPLIMDAIYENHVRDDTFDGIAGTAVTIIGRGADVVRNRMRGCGNGFDVQLDDGDLSFADNVIEGCSGFALRSFGWDADPTHVFRNRITRCGEFGMRLSGSLTVQDNVVIDCGGPGLDLQFESGGPVERNVVGRCGLSGIRLAYYNTGMDARPMVQHNTVFACAGPGISVSGLPVFTIANNIASSNRGPGLAVIQEQQSFPNLSCNDWFANDGGATVGIAPSATDLAVDPGFCDLAGNDVQLMSSSPLLDAPGCGRIGALGQGCEAPPIAMGLEVAPNVLNPISRGRWVIGYLEPRAPFTPADVDLDSLRLQGVAMDRSVGTVIGDHDRNGVLDLGVAFDRAAVEATLPAGEHVTVTVTGRMKGRLFIGTDQIRVLRGQAGATSGRTPHGAGAGIELTFDRPSSAAVSSSPLRAAFTLLDGSPARLELLDVTGRVVASREVGGLGMGAHDLELAEGARLAQGIYFIRLTQGMREARARVVVLR